MTTDIDALVERLGRLFSHRGDGIPTQLVNPDDPAAIEALTRLSEENARLREALTPFANADIDVSHTAAVGVTPNDILRARAALQGDAQVARHGAHR